MATQAQRTSATRIDIQEASHEKLVELLDAHLADALDLYSQLKQANWNVKGSDFIQLHELYDDVVSRSIDKHLWFVEARLQA
jgi:starvation-inducible DNA-binding protein